MKKTLTFLLMAGAALAVVPFLPTALLHAQAMSGKAVEYAAYTEVQKETDTAKRFQMYVDFFSKYPNSEYSENVVYDLNQFIDKLVQEKQFDPIVEFAGKVSPEVKAQIRDRLVNTYFAKGDFANCLPLAEEKYNEKPTPVLANFIAKAAYQGGDVARLEKFLGICEQGGTQAKIDINFQIYGLALQKKDTAKADEYAGKVVKIFEDGGLPDKRDKPVDFAGDWDAYLIQVLNPCYGHFFGANYQAQKYEVAIQYGDKILKVNPKAAGTYLYMSVIYQKMKNVESMLDNLAKAVALNDGQVSEKAKQRLTQMLEDPAKVQARVDKAKADLGL